MQQTSASKPTIPHDAKLAKQVRQLHKELVKPQPAQWPPMTLSEMVPDHANRS